MDFIKANSTLSEEYGVRNILYDNLEYWSSKLSIKPKCDEICLEVKFFFNSITYIINLNIKIFLI